MLSLKLFEKWKRKHIVIEGAVHSSHDIWLSGKPFLIGQQDSQLRFEAIERFFKNQFASQWIKVMELGAYKGYFPMRLSEKRAGQFILWSCHAAYQMFRICSLAEDPQLVLLSEKITPMLWQRLHFSNEFFDAIMIFDNQHQHWAPSGKLWIQMLSKLSRFIIVECIDERHYYHAPTGLIDIKSFPFHQRLLSYKVKDVHWNLWALSAFEDPFKIPGPLLPISLDAFFAYGPEYPLKRVYEEFLGALPPQKFSHWHPKGPLHLVDTHAKLASHWLIEQHAIFNEKLLKGRK